MEVVCVEHDIRGVKMDTQVYLTESSEDEDIFSKEHIHILMKNDKALAKGYLYPYENGVLNPDHPFNVYMDIKSEVDFSVDGMDVLFDKLMVTAHCQVEEKNHYPARIYFSVSKTEKAKKQWLEQKGLTSEVGLYLFTKTDLTPTEMTYPDIRFVECTEDDVLELFLLGYYEAFSDKKTMDQLLLSIEDGTQLYVMQDGDALVGAGLIKLKERYGFIDTVFVTDSYKRQGYGLQLVQFAHQYFCQHDLKESQLEVWGPNISAIGFYENMGYEKIGIQTYSVGKTLKKDLKE